MGRGLLIGGRYQLGSLIEPMATEKLEVPPKKLMQEVRQ